MSKETKFTKGEWAIRHTGPHWNNPELANIEITYSESGECICDTVYRIEDAHLIKTAPKLYAMLDGLISGEDSNLTVNEIMIISELLAEARGE